MSDLIRVNHLSKQYSGRDKQQNEAIKDISFTLNAGQVLGLLGHNGAGKSTLIKCLLGAHSYQGEASVAGLEPVSERANVMEKLAYISDVNVLPEWMTVKQLLKYTSGVHPHFDLATAEAILSSTDIKPTTKIKALSKGMKVQLHLAVVIATDTQILILDEPTLGLDLVYRDTFYRHLLEWFHDGERALIIASHEVAEIEHLLTDVLILKKGQPVLQASMESVNQNYWLVETTGQETESVLALNPISSQKGLGSERWLVKVDDPAILESFEKVKPAALADVFLALQKGVE